MRDDDHRAAGRRPRRRIRSSTCASVVLSSAVGRFVQQQQRRVAGERAGQHDALALPTPKAGADSAAPGARGRAAPSRPAVRGRAGAPLLGRDPRDTAAPPRPGHPRAGGRLARRAGSAGPSRPRARAGRRGRPVTTRRGHGPPSRMAPASITLPDRAWPSSGARHGGLAAAALARDAERLPRRQVKGHAIDDTVRPAIRPPP